MAWLAERAEERLVPRHVMPEVRSALVFWLPHRPPPPPRPEGARGRVAAYAWGRDYHNVARKSLRKVLRWLIARRPEVRTYMSIDTGAILERAFAERAGVGWIGKSSMLIHPKLGSYGSLAVMFTDEPFEASTPTDAHPDRCGTCDACMRECPTGAIVAPGVVDARRCISYWTIEHRGSIPVEVRPSLGDHVFGCDVCQDVCPWNRDAPAASAERWRPMNAWPDLGEWIRSPSDTLDATLEGSPLRRARGEGLRRNALIVAANVGARGLVDDIRRVADDDPDPVLRETALWALQTLEAAAVGDACLASAGSVPHTGPQSTDP
jgi:epoxyqueuosine reductase